jgi:hypothetical protein
MAAIPAACLVISAMSSAIIFLMPGCKHVTEYPSLKAALDATKEKEESATTSSRLTGLRYCFSPGHRYIAQVRYLISTSSNKNKRSVINYLYFLSEIEDRAP